MMCLLWFPQFWTAAWSIWLPPQPKQDKKEEHAEV